MPIDWHRIHENKHIAYTAIGVSLALFIFSITLHFYHHFICQSFCPPNKAPVTTPRQRSSSIMQTAIKVKKLRCLCGTSDDEDFDFFPMSFLLYLLFAVFICLILILKMAIFNAKKVDNPFIDNYNFEYPSIDNIRSFNDVGNNYSHENFYDLLIIIIDIMLIYSIMTMSLTESLFVFYRFYTTLMTTKHLSLLKIGDVLKKFTFYAILFVSLYVVTINLYFWIFPFVILLHCVFNIYCNTRFASILITSYSSFDTFSSTKSVSVDSVDTANQEVVDGAFFMRKVSVISTTLQTVYLTLFMCIYYVNINLIIFYLPILWSISSFIFALNFVRNRYPFNKLGKQLKCISLKDCGVKPEPTTTNEVEMQPTADTVIEAANKTPIPKDYDDANKTQCDVNRTPIPRDNDIAASPTSKSKKSSKNSLGTDGTVESPSNLMPDFKIIDSNQRPGSNTASKTKPFFGAAHTGASIEDTNSGFDISVRTGIDVDDTKREDWFVCYPNPNQNSNINSPPTLDAQFPSVRIARDVNVGGVDIDIIPEDIDEKYKLDAYLLTVKLTLLKRFGFDVRRIKLN